MTTAEVFQILGIVYFIVGAGMLLNPRFYGKTIKDLLDSRPFIYLNGIIALTVGYFMITFNGFWSPGLAVIVSIIGWIAIIKGAFIIVWPKRFIRMAKSASKTLMLSASLATIGGVILIYLGYFVL